MKKIIFLALILTSISVFTQESSQSAVTDDSKSELVDESPKDQIEEPVPTSSYPTEDEIGPTSEVQETASNDGYEF